MNFFEILFWALTGLLAIICFIYFRSMIYEAKKPSKKRKQKIFPEVSLVIPTYDEETTILRKLENIIDLDYHKEMT